MLSEALFPLHRLSITLSHWRKGKVWKRAAVSLSVLVRSFIVLTVEGSHVHGDGGDEALALVELPLQQLAEHVQGDELVAVEDGALRERAAKVHLKVISIYHMVQSDIVVL